MAGRAGAGSTRAAVGRRRRGPSLRPVPFRIALVPARAGGHKNGGCVKPRRCRAEQSRPSSAAAAAAAAAAALRAAAMRGTGSARAPVHHAQAVAVCAAHHLQGDKGALRGAQHRLALLLLRVGGQAGAVVADGHGAATGRKRTALASKAGACRRCACVGRRVHREGAAGHAAVPPPRPSRRLPWPCPRRARPRHLRLLLSQGGDGVEAHGLHLEAQRQAALEEKVLALDPPQPGLPGARG